jgi:HEPN domain-containing protein
MKTLTAEWVAKAEGDYASAGRELRARKSPNYDSCCFHSQQCAEKYLKAFLQENGEHIPKIHNLKEILEMCLKLDESFEFLRSDLILIDRFSVRVRYPGVSAEKDEARSAYKALEASRIFLRQKLNIS